MGFIKNIIMDLYYRRDYSAYARKLGALVGDNCKILCNPRKCFGTEPWLIRIGTHVEITANVMLLTHDGSTWVIREKYPELAIWGTIEIGDNVFVGTGSVIMPNVKIGSNSVIGAGSIVTKDVPSGSVVAGVPARVISDIDSFIKKIKAKSIPVLELNSKERVSYSKDVFQDFYRREKKNKDGVE